MLLLFLFLFSSPGLFAQGQSGISNQMLLLYTLTAFVFLVLITVVIITFYVIRVINMLTESSARQQAEKAGIPYAPSQSWWQILMHKLTRSTPVEQEADILLDHSYDGIRELDNYLPPWWKWLFYGTVVWAVIYLIVYHVAGLLPLSNEEYMAEVEEVQKIRASQEIVQIDENTLEFTAEADLINKGKEVFISNCASCHRNDGGGSVGPNLTDEYWLHGGSVRNIYATIKNGVPEKGMISWAPILKPEEIRDAAFYIMSIQGTNPPGSKAPQGELHVPEPAKVNADSVVAETNL
jgi:cytochrome c oxidase cbb3-type subunit 3